MIIDLRSDTVTRPTEAMLAAMMQAKVGDDVFDEDPSVKELEQKVADYFGMEAGLFCPSGTMTNQIALRISTQPQDEIICDIRSHIYNYEAGGIAYNSLVSVSLANGHYGRLSADDITGCIRPDDVHAPHTSLVCLENTVNKGGGSYYEMENIKEIHAVAKAHNLKLHLDGARLFNALVASDQDAKAYGKYFDTISICLSKGLGAPVGSVLLSDKESIKRANRVRKVFGGGMRQAGYLAAAGIYALDHHIDRLSEDHRRARILSEALTQQSFVREVLPVATNIVIFSLAPGLTPQWLLEELLKHQIKAVPFGKEEVRFVTHLDFDDHMLTKTRQALEEISKEVMKSDEI